MPIEKRLVDATDLMSKLYAALIDAIAVPTTPDEGAFYHVVSGISRTALRNYALLREALDTDDQEHLAWACRNLLELNVFMKNVLTSKARLKEFADYRWGDAIQMVERLVELESKYGKLDSQSTPKVSPTALQSRLSKLNQQKAAEKVTLEGHLITRQWANAVGRVDEFDIINKVCSKFVHPTVWFVMTEDIGSARFPDVFELFFLHGTTYFSEMFADLKEHINKCGLSHTPKQLPGNFAPPPVSPQPSS